jgi:hypothetical protein
MCLLNYVDLPVLAMQMTTEKAVDYCRRRTTFLQQQQQGVQKVRGASVLLSSVPSAFA